MVTLKQLAQLSGLSIRTVGRALSGKGYVAAEKKALVQALAKQYNYTPNLAARNLRLQQKKFVGIINTGYRFTANARKLSMLTRQLTAHGYWPLLGNAENLEICRNMLREWSAVAEYVVVLHNNNLPLLEFIDAETEKLQLKVIFVDCPDFSAKREIKVDRAGSVCRMLEELAAMHFQHLVCCGMLPSRQNGIKSAQEKCLNMQITVIDAAPEFANGYTLGKTIIQTGADAVFFDTDRMAMGFYRYAAENNIRLPEDISVIGFDDEEFALFATPALSTLAHPRQQIADNVIKMITGELQESPPVMTMDFIKRESLKNSMDS